MVWSKMNTRFPPVLQVIALMPRSRRFRGVYGYLRVFEQLLDLWIISRFDLFLVEKIFLLAFVLHVLETMAIEGIFVLFARDIMNNDTLRYKWSWLIVWLSK
jgi:hypothetical protein